MSIVYIKNYKGLTYSEIDLNSNGIVSVGEILYAMDTKKRFLCYKNGTIEYVDKIYNHKICEQIYLEIYLLKDGLSLKKIKIK